MMTVSTLALAAAQKSSVVASLLAALGIHKVGDEALKAQGKCWPLLLVLGLIAVAAGVIIGVVAGIQAITAASNKPAEELAEHQKELKQSMDDLSEANNKLITDL